MVEPGKLKFRLELPARPQPGRFSMVSSVFLISIIISQIRLIIMPDKEALVRLWPGN